MNLDDGSPNPPESNVTVFNGTGTTTIPTPVTQLGDGYHGEGATCVPLDCVSNECPSATVAPTPTPSPPTPRPTTIPSPSPMPTPANQVAFNPSDDAYVAGDLPANNFGTTSVLQSDASPVQRTYLKFGLQSLAAKAILSAKLRMWVTNGSGGTQNIRSVTENNWSEGTLTYSNAPATGATITSFNGGVVSVWSEADLTSAVASAAGSSLSLAIDSASSDGYHFNSNEAAANRVELVVQLGGSATPPASTPTPTPTPTPGNQAGLNPTDDAYVAPENGNHGQTSDLISDGSPIREAYLKFQLQSLANLNITSAKLRMFVTNSSVDVQNLKEVTDNGWTEDTLTYANRPARGATLTTFTPNTINAWREVDVTGYVASKTGSLMSLAIDTVQADGYTFSSSEAASNRVELVVQWNGAAPSPTATPAPIPSTNDVTLAYDVTVGNQVQHWFGAYQPAACEDAVIFMATSGLDLSEPSPTYDFLVAASDDGLTPRNNQWQNIGAGTAGGSAGTWMTVRKASNPSAGVGSYDYNEPSDAPFMLVGVFANHAHRYIVDVHCARAAYPP